MLHRLDRSLPIRTYMPAANRRSSSWKQGCFFFILSCVGEGHVLLLVVSFTSRSPFRIRFVAPQYGSDSGWHGVCYRREQTPYSSEVTLTLNGFRFSGLAADWTHDNCVFTWRPRLHSFRCTSWGGDPRSRDITLLEMLFPPPTPSLEL